MSEVLFFDDDPENFYNSVNLGITGCLVKKNTGLNFKTLITGLRTYSSKMCKK